MFSPSANSLAIAYAVAANNEGNKMLTLPTQSFAAAAIDGNSLFPPSTKAVALAYAKGLAHILLRLKQVTRYHNLGCAPQKLS
jgi:hypothetical protein